MKEIIDQSIVTFFRQHFGNKKLYSLKYIDNKSNMNTTNNINYTE